MSAIDWVRHKWPLKLKDGKRHVFPTLASMVYLNDGKTTLTDENGNLRADKALDADKLGGKQPSEYMLAKDALQIDDNNPAANKTFSSEKIAAGLSELKENIAAVNLLDNSDFRVAQAGYGSMHGDTRYVCDMWYNLFRFGEFSFDKSNGLTMTYKDNRAYACQKIKNDDLYVGKPLTFAVRLSDGSIYVCSGVYTKTTATAIKDFGTCVIGIYEGEVRIIAIEGSVTIKWAVLYEGSYTAETLPLYVAPDPVLELAKCQQYYYPIPTNYSEFSYTGYTADNNVARITIPTPVPMFRTPSLFFPDGTVKMNVYTATTNASASVAQVDAAQSCGVALSVTASSAIPGWIMCTARFAASAALVADLQ